MFETPNISCNFECKYLLNRKEIKSFAATCKKSHIFARFGEMAEWSKAHAWKVCNRQKWFMGSNPILSAFFLKVICFKSIYVFLMSKKLNFDFMIIFSLIMVVMYIGLGIYLIVSKSFDYIPTTYKSVFAFFFIIYGVFRFVRIYPNLKNKKDYEKD